MASKEVIRKALEREGGPQKFTLKFLEHVRRKGEGRLSSMERSTLKAIREQGTDSFVERLTQSFPDLAEAEVGMSFTERAAESIDVGAGKLAEFGAGDREAEIGLSDLVTGRTAPIRAGGLERLGERAGGIIAGAGETISPDQPREPFRFESLPGAAARPAEFVANIPGDALELGRQVVGGILQLTGQTVAAPGETTRAVRDLVAQDPAGAAQRVAEELVAGRSGVEALGERIGEQGAAQAFSGAPVTSLLEASGPMLGALLASSGAIGAKRLAQSTIARTRLRAAAAGRAAAVEELSRTQPLDMALLQKRLAETQPISVAEVERRLATAQPLVLGGDEVVALEEVIDAGAEMSASLHNRTGGSTVNLRSGNQVGQPLSAVALYPERTLTLKGKSLSKEQIREFAEKNQDLLSDPRLSIGTFYDEAKEVSDLDIVATLPHEEAEALGRAARQKSVFKLDDFSVVETGGTGLASSEVEAALGPAAQRVERFLGSKRRVEISPDSPVGEIAYEPAFAVGGEVAKDIAQNPLVRLTSAPNNVIGVSTMLEGGRFLKSGMEELVEATRPKLYDFTRKRPDLSQRMQAFASANDAADGVALIHHRELKAVLRSSRKVDQFWELILDDQLEGIAAREIKRGNDASKVGRLLTAEQKAALLEDADIQSAISYYRHNIQPELEALAPSAGIETFRQTPLGIYAKLNPIIDGKDLDGITLAGGRVVRPRGTGTPQPGTFSRRTARAAKEAKGTAQLYSKDGLRNLEHMFRDRYGASHRNRLVEAIKAEGIDLPEGARIPEGYRIIDVNHEKRIVPEDVAEAYKSVAARSVFPLENARLIKALRGRATQIALYGPADAVSHLLRLTGVLYSQRGIGASLGNFGRTLAVLPGVLPRVAATVADVFNVHGVEAIQDIRELLSVGALRANAFREFGSAQKLGRLPTPARVFFELPEVKRGLFGGRSLMGLDTRARVVMNRLLKSYRPEMSLAERGSTINNAFGTYVEALQPDLVRLLKGSIGFADPFASAGVSLKKAQVKALLGRDAMGFNAETLWSTVNSAVILPITLNAALNDGKMPWELPDLKPGDIRLTTDNGKVFDIPFRLIAANVASGAQALGVRAALDNLWNGTATAGDASLAALRDSTNTLLARVGPIERFLFTTETGVVPFLDPRTGEFMRLARQSHSQLRDNLRLAMRGMLQAPESAIGYTTGQADNPARVTPDSMTDRVISTVGEVFGLNPRQRGGEEELRGAKLRRQKARNFDIAQQVSFEVRRAREAAAAQGAEFDARAFIEHELTSRGFDPQTRDFRLALRNAFRLMKQSRRSIRRAARETEKMLTEDDTVE